MDADLVERARVAVGLISPGRVVSYGDLAELLGVSARHAGRLMKMYGDGVPWWRVTNAAGDLSVLEKARPYWRAEGIDVKPNGLGCRIRDYRADLVAWADAVLDAWERSAGE